MDLDFPKLLFRPGSEPQVLKINNHCRMSVLDKLKEKLPVEYKKVCKDPAFGQIVAVHENCLGYSARLIHTFMCKQLITDKVHELWFVFARRPLRFSLQEFHAVTGLNCIEDGDCDSKKWKDDQGFWSKLLKKQGKISIKKIMDEHLPEINQWDRVDRLRLVYVCVIAGVLLAKDEKAIIPLIYIKLVMDIDKLRRYPWGIKAYDLLLDSIFKTRPKLSQINGYHLDGFSYAFQIWIMEVIPDFGTMLGKRLDDDITGPRCSKWSGAAKVSYEDIIQLESSFGSEVGPTVFTYKLADRVIRRRKWLENPEIDAVMYLFRENTTLRRWKPDRVAFMDCIFSVQISTAYRRFLQNKKAFKLESFLLDYGKGELPSHGRAGQVWDVDVNRIYVPVNINSNHWISLYINFGKRTIQVFDCSGTKHNRYVEAFAVMIPRIMKEIKSAAEKKYANVRQYAIHYVPMKSGLNKIGCHCGVYALKYIECHALGIDVSVIDDENIMGARIKLVVDLWRAGNDPVLIDRMAKFQPRESDHEPINLD